MSTEPFLDLAARELARYKGLADRAMAQVSDEQFFEALSPIDNSIAIVVKHIAGNARSRWTDFLTSDGEKPDRHRDTEFELAGANSREQLMAAWEEGWRLLFEAIAPLGAADLDRTVTIRGEGLSVRQAIGRQMTHYAYHVGQIVYVARHLAGDRWTSLSIPKGQSEAFNSRPATYV
ncbi:MAG TPA: DUF1572 family protein [Vicinamibacterales bacterium]|jgi:uncharacterized damage-inducible protein DinB